MYEFRKYCIVGGMPEAIKVYAQTKDLLSLDTIYDALIASYSDDIEKYSPNETQTKVMRHILETGWQKGGETITSSALEVRNTVHEKWEKHFAPYKKPCF